MAGADPEIYGASARTARRIPRTDMQMDLGRMRVSFARQRGAASGTESAPPAGRRVEPGDLALADLELTSADLPEHRDGRTAMPAATLAMTPCHIACFAGHRESHCPTETATFTAIAHRGSVQLDKAKQRSHRRPEGQTRRFGFGETCVAPPPVKAARGPATASNDTTA